MEEGKQERVQEEEEEEEEVEVESGLTSKNKENEEEKRMSPWEQHSAVIILPRFDYNAPSSLLHHSHSGFLITCPIKREKSATKEVISLLSKYVQPLSAQTSGGLDDSGTNGDSKRRKLCNEEIGQECSNGVGNKENSNHGEISGEPSSSPAKIEENGEKGILSLVKLTRSGLLLFTFSRNNSTDTSNIVSDIFQSLDSGTQKPLNWCHRIFPIQATCKLNEENLCGVVSKLVQQFVDSKQNKHEGPMKFAVAYNRRGIDEKELKAHKSISKESNSLALLDRNKCFGLVATVVKSIIEDSVVDLKTPEFAVLIELLPLSGMPNASVVAAVSVLPHNLINTKPKLSIKALVSDPKK